MSTINLNELRITNARNFKNSLWSQTQRNSYIFFGKPTSWSDSTDSDISDTNPPYPKNNLADDNAIRHQMMYLERIPIDRVYHMIPRITWTSNRVYDMFRNDYSDKNLSSSGKSNLYDTNYVVVNGYNQVYVCLYNGTSPNNPNGSLSTTEPQSTSGLLYEPFFTTDGYQWLYLYTLTGIQDSDSTRNYIPIGTYEGNVVSGGIYTIIVNSYGNGYSNSPIGNPNSNIEYFYCKVVGDGEGAVARVKYQNGGFTEVRIVAGRYGSGYTYANLDFSPYHIYASLSDLDNRRNPISLGFTDKFRTTCVISPFGGWGSDLISQLGGTKIGIFLTSGNTTSNLNLSLRQLGIINNVEDLNGVYISTSRAEGTFSIHTTMKSGIGYVPLEIIEQEVDAGIDGFKKARGTVISWNPTTNIIKYFQDPSIHTDEDGDMWTFRGSKDIVGKTSNAISVVDASNLIGFVGGYAYPQFNKLSGKILYVSNFAPIVKLSQQTENINVIISY